MILSNPQGIPFGPLLGAVLSPLRMHVLETCPLITDDVDSTVTVSFQGVSGICWCSQSSPYYYVLVSTSVWLGRSFQAQKEPGSGLQMGIAGARVFILPRSFLSRNLSSPSLLCAPRAIQNPTDPSMQMGKNANPGHTSRVCANFKITRVARFNHENRH